VVSACLRKRIVEVLDWPRNTTSMMSIENVWSYMKNNVAEKQTPSAKKTCNFSKEVCMKKMNPNYCASLVKSMDNRLDAAVGECRH